MTRRHAVTSAVLAASLAVAGACAVRRSKAIPVLDRLPARVFLDEALLAPRGGAAPRKVFPDGVVLTKQSEGWVPTLYEDVGRYCTIGYGHLVKKAPCDGSEPEEFRKGLSEPRGVELLVSDMELAERAVSDAVKVDLSDAQYAALCDFVFNVGATNFRKSTLLQVVNEGRLPEVAPQLRRWVKVKGVEWEGLRRRRDKEIVMFYGGLVPREGAIPLPAIDLEQGE